MVRKKILIIDDEKDFTALLHIRLSSAGYEVFTLSDPLQIQEKVQDVVPDLILLDVRMPGMDGFEAKIKLNADPLTAAIPVIFLTANDSVADEIKGLRLGADDYIAKPFNSDELLARIESALSRRQYYEVLALTDGLTGLYNVTFFKKQFALFFDIAKRYNKAFSIAVIDVDNLKQINDTFGHFAGDCVLKEIAVTTKEVFRKTDIVTRYGGDEFVVIMPETDKKRADQAIERFHKAVGDRRCMVKGKPIQFQVSSGVATYDVAFLNENALFELADKRLYLNKGKKQA